MLKGLEYRDLYHNSLEVIEKQDSLLLERRKKITLLTATIEKQNGEIVFLEKRIDTFWDDIKEYGLGGVIGSVATVLVLIFF